MNSKSSRQALEGVKVADFTWVAAGPITTAYLSQHGATVVRVESTTRPDHLRMHPPAKDNQPGINRSFVFAELNPNKLSMSINLNHPKGIELAMRLACWADVFAENFVPGRIEQWGLGYDDVRKVNPSIIYYRSSPQGQTGPEAMAQALGLTLQSLSGFTYLTGWPDRDPSQPWGAITDMLAPVLGASALLAALDHRARTGEGQYLDLSQYEAGVHYLAPALLDYFANGKNATRMGNASLNAAPHAAYRCKGLDRWCVIAVLNDEQWRSFCNVMGNPDWTTRTEFSTMQSRKENESELNRLIEEWTAQHSPEEAMALLQAAGVSAGVVENSQDLFDDPQLRARAFWRPLDHREIGRITHRGPGFKLSKTPSEFKTSGPCLGEHTEYVCREFLGMSDNEFVELMADGALE